MHLSTPTDAAAGSASRLPASEHGPDLTTEPLRHVVVALRPLGSPTSLGLFGLAAATFTLAGLQLGWVPPAEGKPVALVLIGFAAPAQLLASVLAFGARDGVVGTAMGVLSLTWLSTGLVLLTSAPGARSGALGLVLVVSAVAVGLSGVTGTLSKLATAAVLITASLRIALTAVFELFGQEAWKTAAGVVGVLLTLLAVGVAWASEMEEAGGPLRVPLGRRGKGADAVTAPLAEQAGDVATEPGVRTLL